MSKKLLAMLLTVVMVMALTVPAFAAGTAETFVLRSSTITVHNVLRSETVSFPEVSAQELTVHIVDSEDYITFDIKANSGFEYSDMYWDIPAGGSASSYASVTSTGYRWNPAGGFEMVDAGHLYLTGPETFSWGYPYEHNEAWVIDESSRAPYLLLVGGEWFMTESDFFAVTAAQPEQPTPATNAVLSSQGLKVDGKEIDCEKYNIADRNYFKLRDLAQLLSGTSSQFEVGYDEATATVSITTGKPYTPNGTELLSGVDNSASAQPSNQAILINGEKNEELTVYNIGGSNFFQLRELGSILGFEVDYDQDTNTAIVNSVKK